MSECLVLLNENNLNKWNVCGGWSNWCLEIPTRSGPLTQSTFRGGIPTRLAPLIWIKPYFIEIKAILKWSKLWKNGRAFTYIWWGLVVVEVKTCNILCPRHNSSYQHSKFVCPSTYYPLDTMPKWVVSSSCNVHVHWSKEV